jgi:hypothetical protein
MRLSLTLTASLVALWMLAAVGCLLPAQKPWETLDDDSADLGMTLADDDDALDEALEVDEEEEELEEEESDELIE